MKHLRMWTALAAAFITIYLVPTARADEWNKRTVLTINAPIEVPGRVLPAGTYVMVLQNSLSDRHIVQVFDKDQRHIIATILAIPNYRLQPTGKTKFVFWEVPEGQPKALRAWFYPGDNTGQEFAYPKREAAKIAAYTKTPVPTTSAQSEQELTTAPVTRTDQAGASSGLDRDTYAAPASPAPSATAQTVTPAPTVSQPAPSAPVEMAQSTPNQPAPQASATPNQLPATASYLPLVGLIGLIFLAASGLVTILPRWVR